MTEDKKITQIVIKKTIQHHVGYLVLSEREWLWPSVLLNGHSLWVLSASCFIRGDDPSFSMSDLPLLANESLFGRTDPLHSAIISIILGWTIPDIVRFTFLSPFMILHHLFYMLLAGQGWPNQRPRHTQPLIHTWLCNGEMLTTNWVKYYSMHQV